ncbi:MAG TPA: sulfite exporter TauE/SafE family protein [Gemmatimonadaceae bacterium]|nr:sulfite exporter TauE/SafE family protein [Gemmatimonadaceae bacterium]
MLVLGYVFALFIGLTLGMLGAGGSILTVPVFVYVLRFDPKLAVTMSLPVVGLTSLVGAISHWRAGNVNVRSVLSFGVVAMAAAFAGARASVFLAAGTQLFLLGVAMLTAAVLMLRDSFRTPRPMPATPGAGPDAGRASAAGERPRSGSPLALPLAGLFVGALTGIVGIGGGFIIVPALVLLAQLPMREAVGTSLTVITMNAAAGFAGQHRLRELPLDFLLVFGGVAMAGIIAGTWLARFLHQRTLKRAFAALLLVLAVLVLWQNRALP